MVDKKQTHGEKQFETLQGLNQERNKILEIRNKQYASDNDFVANFRDVADIATILGIKVNGREVALILAILKMVRNENGIKSNLPPEDRRDHIIDAGNYIDLAFLGDIQLHEVYKQIVEQMEEDEKIEEGIPIVPDARSTEEKIGLIDAMNKRCEA